MARKILALIFIVFLLPLAAPASAAKASSGEGGEVVIRTLHVPHFDIWLHSDGVTWQGGRPGETVTHPESGFLPAAIAERYDLVAPPEVTTDITEELYNQTLSPDLQQRGWWGKSWQDFYLNIYRYRPLEHYRASIPVSWQEINQTRKAMVVYEFKLSPYAPRAEQLVGKFPAGLSYKYPFDLREYEERNGQHFEAKVEGWRWELPVVVTWHLKERPKPPDLYVKSLNPGTSEVEEGKRYTGTVVFGLKSTVSGPVQAKLELTHLGYAVPGVNGQVVEFAPGEEKSFSFSFTGQNQDSVLEAKIRPVSGQDANWSDNSKRVTVPLVRAQQPSPGSPSLTFQAVSQTRTKVRPPGTAKWTDWVTATLRVSEPTPPRGRVVSWRIVSATLTYPKRNPNFTFGNPVPPVGTRTVTMTPKGHEATVEFQEDWALDGTPIYNLLTGQLMAAEPKYYTITASYTVEYEYEWEETESEWVPDYDQNGNVTGGHWESYTVTRRATGTSSGTVTGQLLVNGTGVDSKGS